MRLTQQGPRLIVLAVVAELREVAVDAHLREAVVELAIEDGRHLQVERYVEHLRQEVAVFHAELEAELVVRFGALPAFCFREQRRQVLADDFLDAFQQGVVGISPLDTPVQERRGDAYFFLGRVCLRLRGVDLQVRQEIVAGLVGGAHLQAVEVDASPHVVDGMSGEVRRQVEREVSIFVFFGKVQGVRTEVAHFHTQVEVGYRLAGDKAPVHGDFPVVVVEREVSVEPARLEVAVQRDVLILVMVVLKRRNLSLDVRFQLVVAVLQSLQLQVERSLPEFLLGQQFPQLEVLGRDASRVAFLQGQRVGVHGHVGVELSRTALDGAVGGDA